MRGTQDGRFRIAEYVMSSILSGKTTLLIRMRDLDRAPFGGLDVELLSVSLAVNLTAHSGDLVWLFRRDLRSILNAKKRKTAARARQHWLWRFSQQAVEIERASVHVDLAVGGARPFVRRAVSVKLEPVLVRIAQI